MRAARSQGRAWQRSAAPGVGLAIGVPLVVAIVTVAAAVVAEAPLASFGAQSLAVDLDGLLARWAFLHAPPGLEIFASSGRKGSSLERGM
mmetsp:Transcript_13241/g.26619  ORF Transcript_13241/g.26619 Transcript_13241/m.26619 type:complete len:90 (-) Transcript_13241:576-845(-)